MHNKAGVYLFLASCLTIIGLLIAELSFIWSNADLAITPVILIGILISVLVVINCCLFWRFIPSWTAEDNVTEDKLLDQP